MTTRNKTTKCIIWISITIQDVNIIECAYIFGNAAVIRQTLALDSEGVQNLGETLRHRQLTEFGLQLVIDVLVGDVFALVWTGKQRCV